MIRGLLDSGHPFLKGITLERLERERFVRLQVSDEGEPFLPFAEGRFGTASGKCEFHAETIGYTPPVESRLGDPGLRTRFPLEMISPKNHGNMNSTFGEREQEDQATAAATLHPADAAARGIRKRRRDTGLQRSRIVLAGSSGQRCGSGGCGERAIRAIGEESGGSAKSVNALRRARG